jgi:hypothetical protein
MNQRKFPFGEGRELGYLMRLRVEILVSRRSDEPGLHDALLIALLIEKAYALHHRNQCGFFNRELLLQVAQLCGSAPESLRPNLDIGQSRLLRSVVQQDMGQQIFRVLTIGTQSIVDTSMELVALFEMYMKYTLGDEYEPYSLHDVIDVEKTLPLKAAIKRCTALMYETDPA